MPAIEKVAPANVTQTNKPGGEYSQASQATPKPLPKAVSAPTSLTRWPVHSRK
jgi:hypothetical protein